MKNRILNLEKSKNIFILFLLCAILYFHFNKNESKRRNGKLNLDTNQEHVDFFKQIALKTKTDKVRLHHYENLYGNVLGPLRFKQLNFLEIGLGCGQSYGPGKSLPIWREFLPNTTISMLEFDEKCAQTFRNSPQINGELYIGDQSDLSLLKTIGKKGGLFDVIVDDGGHSWKQQTNSLIGLWPFLSENGGVYIIEDFFTSFLTHYKDSNESSFDLITELISLLNNPNDINVDSKLIIFPTYFKQFSQQATNIRKDLLSIHCFERACALIKK